MKLKKLLMGIGLSISLLSAVDLPMDVSKIFENGWNFNFVKQTTNYLISPIDIDYSQLQKILQDNQSILVYRWYQDSTLTKANFGFDVFAYVEITKDAIKYHIKKNGEWESPYTNFEDFKNEMYKIADEVANSEEADEIENFDDKLDKFKRFYVPGFEKIKSRYIYLIKTKGMDLNLSFGINPNEIGGMGNSGASENNNNTENQQISQSNENQENTTEETSNNQNETNTSEIEEYAPPSVNGVDGVETPPTVN